MNYKKYTIQMMYLVVFSIFFSLQGSDKFELSLLVSQKNTTYQSVSISEKRTNTKNIIDKSQFFCLPKDICQTIHKFINLCRWKDEFNFLESISPVKIANAELWAIDLWRLSPEDRKKALSYHGKMIFDQEECKTLKKIMSQEIKQDLEIHRLPLNDELYQDWAGIPGGRVYARFLFSPGVGVLVTIVGGPMICAFAHPVLNYGDSLAISGGIGAGITVIGTAIAYARHRWFLAQHPVAIQLRDV